MGGHKPWYRQSVEGVLVVREGGKNTIRALPSYPTEPPNALRWAGGSSWDVRSLHLYVHPLKGEKRLRKIKKIQFNISFVALKLIFT